MNCSACAHIFTEGDEIHELEDEPENRLCNLCFDLNNFASEFGYDEIRAALTRLEELGSRQSETIGATGLA